MKIVISNKSLKSALRKLKGIVPARATVPALEALLIEADAKQLKLIASDMEVTLIMTLDLETPVDKPGKALVPFAWLNAISNLESDQPLEFSFTKKSLVVTSESDRFKQDGLEDVKNFPALPEVPNERSISMDNDFIATLNAALLICDVKEELQPWKSKVNMEITSKAIYLTSTNGTVLYTYVFHVEAKSQTECMISHKVIKALEGFKDTNIYWNEKFIVFESENVKVIATRPQGKYVNWRSVVPDHQPNLSISRTDLIHGLDKITLANGNVCFLELKNEAGITITAKDEDLQREGSVMVPVAEKYSGEVERISVNPGLLLKLLHQVEYDELLFAIHDASKAVLLTAETDKNYTGFIMPFAQK